MNDRLLCQQLFAYMPSLFKNLFDSVRHPWEIMPILRSYIEDVIRDGVAGYDKIKEDVIVGQNVRIADSAIIEGPAVIGDGCEIRHGAFLRGSVLLGKGCVIGNSSEIKNSVLMDGAQAPHFNYVGDSVLGCKAHLGAGAICSNLRSDQKSVFIRGGDGEINTGLRKLGAILGDGAEIGCGAVLCPGSVIGKNTTVYPLTLVRGVCPADSIVKHGDIIKKEGTSSFGRDQKRSFG